MILKEHERLTAARLMEGLSQSEVAKIARCHQTAISKMEQGVVPISDNLIRRFGLGNKKMGETPEWILARIARKRRKLTQKDVCELLAVPLHVIGEMENGHREITAAYRKVVF